MPEVDPADKTIASYLVRHHRFDPETNHFRWFILKAFDNEGEMNQLLESLWSDLEARKIAGSASPKEQIAGQINDPEWDKKHRSGGSPYNPAH